MLNYLYDFDFTSLFVDELGWDYPSNNEIELTVNNQKYRLTSQAEKRGFVVYKCHALDTREMPDVATRCKIYEVVSGYTYEHLLIYVDPVQQIWQWVKKYNNESIYREYLVQYEQENESLLDELTLIKFEIAEESHLTILKVIEKVDIFFNCLAKENSFISFNQLKTFSYYVELGDEFTIEEDYDKAIECYKNAIKINPDTYEIWHELGNILLNIGCYEEAIKSYENALKINPNNYQILRDKGDAFKSLISYPEYDKESQNSYEEAIRLYKTEFEVTSNFCQIDYNYNLGNLLFSIDRYHEAILAYNQCVQIDPNNYIIWNDIGETLFEMSRYEEAIEAYNQSLKIDSNDYVAWKYRGEALEKLCKYEEALYSYDNSVYIAIKYNERDWIFLVDKHRQCLIHKINKVKSIRDYKIQRSRKLNNQASRLNEGEKYEEALFSINAALKLNPKLYQAWYNKGLILRNLDRYNDAIDSHIEAFRLCGNDFDMPYEIACCYALQSKVKKAVEYLKIAIAASPEVYINKAHSDSDFDLIRDSPSFKALVISDEEKAYELYKQAQERMIYGEYDKAIISFGKFLKLQPDHAEALYEIACCYALQNKVQKAVEHLKEAIALSPDRYLAKARTDSNFELIRHRSSFKSLVSSDEEKVNDLYSQAKATMANEDYKQAITIYNKALKIQPDNVIALLDKGFALFKLERYEEALKDLQKATDLDNKGYIWHILDSAYCQFSDHENIFTCYSKACKTNPYSPEILYGMARVYSLRKMYVDAASCYEEALNLNPLLLPARIELSQVNEILDDERNKRIEQEKKRKAEEQKRVEQELKRKAEEQKRVEQEKKKKADEKEKQKREEDRRNREKKKSRDPVSQVINIIGKMFFGW
ncbi:tetratricopeptide repeat protein [Pseudanabaena sp. ABRG5-3]|uniref:tetratricopeptide repeat protein n=1 Tax=Pseudanabaena sp. ABRG5-3 TaxID=685565 RepID=UPI000DC6ECE0|nr:tetratricopeptide repeat protein [Pseudanabaena sp. ABRG5-3]BBC24589.1 tetratricopeptide repeat family [Pseudanabaena sp. ABRG5-3]